MAIVMYGQLVWLGKFSTMGVGGGPLSQVHPILWWALFLELLVMIGVAGLWRKSIYAYKAQQNESMESREDV